MSPIAHPPNRNAHHRGPATRILRVLLGINAAATIAAAIVLALAPATIPQMVGIDLPASQNFLAYLLAASELAVGSLCLLALRSGNTAVLRLTAGVLIIFHLASGVAGLAAIAEQASPLILWNAALRAAMIAALGLSMRASYLPRTWFLIALWRTHEELAWRDYAAFS